MSLNPIQAKVVNWTGGPLLLLAGPGSGKTRVLTYRTAKVINESQDKKYRILVLTFTNKAADEYRTRMEILMGENMSRLFIGTFHSFAVDLLRQYGNYIGVKSDFKIYSNDKDIQIVLTQAVSNLTKQYDFISDRDRFRVKLIQQIESRLVDPDQVSSLFKNKELGYKIQLIYKAYLEELSNNNALDFNTIILKAYELLKKYPSLSKNVRQVYHYIFVDEFQDTNLAQYQLMVQLTSDKYENILVAADDDQIIYEWNGASYDRINDYKKRFNPSVIQLPINYRCPNRIVEYANKLISYNSIREINKEPLKAFENGNKDDSFRLIGNFDNIEKETLWIAKDIMKKNNRNYGDFTILLRTKKTMSKINKILEENQIPTFIYQRKDNFESIPIDWIHSTIKLSVDVTNMELLESVIGKFTLIVGHEYVNQKIKEIPEMQVNYLYEWVKHLNKNKENEKMRDISRIISDNLILKNDFKAFSYQAVDWIKTIIDSKKSNSNVQPFTNFIEEKDTYFDLQSNILRNLGNEIPTETFLQELDMRSKDPKPPRNHVILMTIHSSKGKEFDHVYVPCMVEEIIPSFQSIKNESNINLLEEERRNFYVAITRTIKSLTLTYSKKYWRWNKNPSRFLYEMGALSK
jgi:DNA helicase-2/ATP-dependent DNA helicase PcrA